MDKEQMGKLLAELRKRENISQKDMAERLNIVPSTLCKWERGQASLDISYLESLATILNVSYEELLHPEKTLQRLYEASKEQTEAPYC